MGGRWRPGLDWGLEGGVCGGGGLGVGEGSKVGLVWVINPVRGLGPPGRLTSYLAPSPSPSPSPSPLAPLLPLPSPQVIELKSTLKRDANPNPHPR